MGKRDRRRVVDPHRGGCFGFGYRERKRKLQEREIVMERERETEVRVTVREKEGLDLREGREMVTTVAVTVIAQEPLPSPFILPQPLPSPFILNSHYHLRFILQQPLPSSFILQQSLPSPVHTSTATTIFGLYFNVESRTMSNPTFNSPLYQPSKGPVSYAPTTPYHPTNAFTYSKHSKTFIVVISISLGLLVVLFLSLCLWIYKVLHPPASANANFGPPAMA
uniref:Uncharacterized protein n=1 Tax=Fagus sylvatica TaxID=28930 RepID=A0A2N9HQG8_FAGSY